MTTKNISIYSNIKETKNGKEIPIDVLLQYIHDGKWQDDVLSIQTGKKSKDSLPYVTISGKFSERKIAGLIQHSGFICIDVDDVIVNDVKAVLKHDKYLYSAFVSVSGTGLALIFKINPEKHNEAFEGLQEYLFTNYQIIVDPSCRDVSRARFISFDPWIIINDNALKFTQYPEKRKALNKVPDVIFVQSDFDTIINEVITRRIDLTGDYSTWLRIGFAITDKFGEAGRHYYHAISQFHPQYSPAVADRQYTNCLKANKHGVTIATLYFLAKTAGIDIVSEKTKMIAQVASNHKKGRATKEESIATLQQFEGITPEESNEIVTQVFDNNIEVDTGDDPIAALELWLKHNYEFRRNAISQYIEKSGVPMQQKDFNTVFIASKKVFEKMDYKLVERVIDSDYIPEYNPIIDFFEKYKDRKPQGCIKALFETLETDTGTGEGQFFPDYASHFGTRWLAGIIASVFGEHCPLMLVLSGSKQGTGKTEFFRRLLPKELSNYYAESKLDRDKDDEILMTQKLIIMDDEYAGKNKKESSRLKEMLSKQTFSLRAPYGKGNVDLRRLAVLCGTTNHNEILNDPTGNRRIIPINVLSINQAVYNSIDKIDLLIEAYHLYKSGFAWELSGEDVKNLNDNTEQFQDASPEYELIVKYFRLPQFQKNSNETKFFTGTEIKDYLEKHSVQKLNHVKIGQELKKIGWNKTKIRDNGKEIRGYYVIEKVLNGTG